MLKFTVDGQKLELLGDPHVVADSFDYLTGSFKFYSGHDWDLTEKHAFFQLGEATPYEVTLVDDEFVKTDHVNLTTGVWSIYVIGYDIDGATLVERITTNKVNLTVDASGVPEGEPFPPSIIPDVLIVKDQTTPQTFINGMPRLAADRVIENENDMVDAKFVNDSLPTIPTHNNLTEIQGGSATERYHMTQSQNTNLHSHDNKTALDNVTGTNTGDQDLSPYAKIVDLHSHSNKTDLDKVSGTNTGDQDLSSYAKSADLHSHSNKADLDKVSGTNTGDQDLSSYAKSVDLHTHANKSSLDAVSGTNTGDQDVSGAISTHNTDATAHPRLIQNKNWLYDGRDLSTIFTVAQLIAAVRAADWTNIRIGDYWPITLNGTFRDRGYYTCPTLTNYYSDTALTSLVGQTSMAYQATYVNSTYCSISVSSTTRYVSTAACTAYYARTLSNATFKMEVAGIDSYYQYGDAAVPHHIDFISRDCIAVNLLYNTTDTNSGAFIGSALFTTLNDSANGLVALLPADLAAVIIQKRGLTETKTGATASNWAWNDMGKLWLPTEREVWGQDIWSERGYGGGLAMQYPIFKDSSRHIIKGDGNGGLRAGWRCASSMAGSATNFCVVSYAGYPFYASAILPSVRVPLCFRIA